MHKFSIKESLSLGWSKTKKHFWFLFLVALATLVVSSIFSFDSGDDSMFSALLSLVGWIVNTFIQIGFIRILLKILNDERGGINDFLPSWNMFWSVFLGQIIYGVIVFAGLILLIVPGIIWAIKYGQFLYLIVDKNLGPIEAIKESGRITSGEKGNLFLFYLASFGVVILGLLALVVGLFAAVPTVMIAGAYIYKKLSDSEVGGVHISAEVVSQVS